jgi:hypothetical protein
MNCLIQNNINKKTCFDIVQLLHILKGIQTYFKKFHYKYAIKIDTTDPDILLQKIQTCLLILYSKYTQEQIPHLDFFKYIKDKDIRDEIRYFVFKPKIDMISPLNTLEIKQIMFKYTKLFQDTFKFYIGSADLYKQLDKNDYIQMLYYNKIGFILNLDDANLPGSHWISIFISKSTKTIEYFDSEGNIPSKKSIKKFILILEKLFIDYELLINKNKFQKYGVNCGVYSMYFIIQRLLQQSFLQITTNVLNENQVVLYRKLLLS